MVITCSQMLEIGLRLIDKAYFRHRNFLPNKRLGQFKGSFGVHALVAARVYHDAGPQRLKFDGERKVKYFLIALYWMRKYPTETDMANTFGYDEDTLRGWCWYYAEVIQSLTSQKVG